VINDSPKKIENNASKRGNINGNRESFNPNITTLDGWETDWKEIGDFKTDFSSFNDFITSLQ
jgi:hypothetical protein